jgi:hypothetical protein
MKYVHFSIKVTQLMPSYTFLYGTKVRHMKSYRKIPRLGQKRNAGLTYSILAAISFKIAPLGMYTAIP